MSKIIHNLFKQNLSVYENIFKKTMAVTRTKRHIPEFDAVKEKYKGRCPYCNSKLIFAEASFYCPTCGFCESDFSLERKDS